MENKIYYDEDTIRIMKDAKRNFEDKKIKIEVTSDKINVEKKNVPEKLKKVLTGVGIGAIIAIYGMVSTMTSEDEMKDGNKDLTNGKTDAPIYTTEEFMEQNPEAKSDDYITIVQTPDGERQALINGDGNVVRDDDDNLIWTPVEENSNGRVHK